MSDQPEDDPHAAPAPAPQPEREPTALEAAVSQVPSGVWIALVVVLGVWALLGPLSGLVVHLMTSVQERRREKEGFAPLLREAQTARATYETARPGQLVHWCIDHPSFGNTFVEGRVSDKLLWTNEAAAPITNSVTSGGRCRGMLARVVERRPEALVLEYLGQP